MRVTRSLLALFAASALMIPFAACGDDGDSPLASDDDTSDVTDDTAADDATDDSADDSDGSDSDSDDFDDVGGDLGDFCLNDEYSEAFAEVGEAMGSLGSGTETDFGALEEFFDAFADEAPDEIADDFRVYADFWSEYAETLGSIDLTDPDTFSDPDVLAAFEDFDTEALDEASQNIDDWVTENC